MTETRKTTIAPGFSEKEAWLLGPYAALKGALDGASMETSLGLLVQSATEQLGPEARAAFYLANPERTAIHHIVGMPADYAEAVDGFKVGPDSLACGLATHTGKPILTADVTQEPLWQPWLWMAKKFGYRACWSFPIHTAADTFVGTLAIYWPQPREATPRDCELVAMLTQAAGIIIARHMDAEERSRSKRALRKSQAQLRSELADNKLLQSISAEMAHEGNVETLYEKILDAAVAVMRSQFGSMQMYYPERGSKGELRLLAARGFSLEATKFWEWVRADSGCTCGQVLRTGRRAIADDVETCEFMAGTPDRDALLAAGIRAAQSTPLISRSGVLVGMISTHWDRPHKSTTRDLGLLDIIARQAADLIERKKGEQELRESEERFRAFIQATSDVVYRMSADWTEMRHLQGRKFISDTLEPSRTWLDNYIHHEDQKLVLDTIQRAIQSKSVFELEHRVIQVDGSVGWANSRAIPILDDRGEIVEWFGAVRDVTQRKRAEEDLRESEARFRMLADNMGQLAWTCDKLGNVTWYNKRWIDYTGLSFEEMKDWGWTKCHHPDHIDRVVASVTRSRESGEIWEDTFPLRGKDDQYRWFLSRAYPIRDKTGEIVRWFGTNTDITERKQAEDTQQVLLNELNHRVKNTLAIVQAIAQRTAARTRNPAEFADSFGGRIQSLARVHTLLSGTSWQGADLRELLRDQLLSGTVDETRLTAWGPAVRLDPQMALHWR